MECFVEEACEEWGKEGSEVFEDGWCDVEDVGCFVSVEGSHDFFYLLDRDFLDVESWVSGWVLDFAVLRWEGWDGFAGFVSNGDEEVVQCVCDGLWFCMCFLLVCDLCG